MCLHYISDLLNDTCIHGFTYTYIIFEFPSQTQTHATASTHWSSDLCHLILPLGPHVWRAQHPASKAYMHHRMQFKACWQCDQAVFAWALLGCHACKCNQNWVAWALGCHACIDEGLFLISTTPNSSIFLPFIHQIIQCV